MKKLSPIILVFILLFSRASAQIPSIIWQHCYGGTNSDICSRFVETIDGKYVFIGSSMSNNGDVSGHHSSGTSDTTFDGWVLKTTNSGAILWEKSIGGSGSEILFTVAATSDSGIIVGGQSSSNNGDVSGHHGSVTLSDCWVAKLDANGSIMWQHSFGGSGDDVVASVIQTSDGGYIFTGRTNSTDGDITSNHGGYDCWVVKLSVLGSIEWQRCYGGLKGDGGNSIKQTTDGGYIVLGTSLSLDGDVTGHHGSDSTQDIWALKLTATGGISWENSFGGPVDDFAEEVIQTLDGGYTIAGSSNGNGGDITGIHGYRDGWIVKLSASGTLEWQKALGGTDIDQANSVIQEGDSTYLVGAITRSNDGDVTGVHGTSDAWLVKLNTHGDILWQKTYGGSAEELSNTVKRRMDGGLMLFNTTNSNDGDVSANHGGYDFWIVSLTSDLLAGYITGPTSVCAGASITLTDTTSGGTWSVTNSHATVSTGGVVTGSWAGVDTVLYTIGSGASVAKYPITIDPLPVVGAVSGPGIVCTGASVTMSDTSLTGNWSVSNPHAIISVSGMVNGVSPGIDTVFYTVTNACGSTSQPLVIAVNASVMADVAFSISPSDTVCVGTPVTLTSIPTNGGTSPHFYWQLMGITVDSGATYTYVPTNGDVLSCNMATSMVCASPALAHSTTDTMHVIPLVTPTVHITSTPVDSVAYSGELVTFHSFITNGGTAPTYQWIVNGVPISGATDSVYAANVFGNDSVYCLITSNANCADSTIAVSNGLTIYNAFVGITDPSLKSNIFSLYPNPNNGSFTLNGMSLGNIEPITLEVTNMLGQIMWTKKVPYKQGMIVDLHGDLVPGNYLLKVKQDAYQQILHLVISGN